MCGVDLGTFGLANVGKEFAEPFCIDIERLAAGDAREFDGAQLVVFVVVVTDYAADSGLG